MTLHSYQSLSHVCGSDHLPVVATFSIFETMQNDNHLENKLFFSSKENIIDRIYTKRNISNMLHGFFSSCVLIPARYIQQSYKYIMKRYYGMHHAKITPFSPIHNPTNIENTLL